MKRNKKRIMVAGLMLLLLALWFAFFYNPYTHYDLRYEGESESWTAECSVKGKARWVKEDGALKYDSYRKRVLMVTYKGDESELSNAKNIKIDYKFPGGGGGIDNMNFNDEQLRRKYYVFENDSFGGGFPVEGGIYPVKISVDGKEQIIELRSK